MKDLSTGTGIGTDPDFLNGNLVDSQTLLNTTILQDIVQFFQKLKAKAGLTENGLFDNEVNNYQTVEALDKRNDYIDTGQVARIFDFCFTRKADLIVAVVPADFLRISYPYSYSFDYAKFDGILSFKRSGVTYIKNISAISSATDLTSGITLSGADGILFVGRQQEVWVENTGPGVVSELSFVLSVKGIAI